MESIRYSLSEKEGRSSSTNEELGENDSLLEQNSPTTATKQEGEEKKEQKKDDKIIASKKGKRGSSQRLKRPMNAFMVWSSIERKRLAEREPHLHNTELSKRLGEMWKGMTDETKKPFREEALRLKAKLMEEHPDYKYRPRRRKDINALRNPSCLFETSSPYGKLHATQPIFHDKVVKLYQMKYHPHAGGQLYYPVEVASPVSDNLASEKGYMYHYPYVSSVPQPSFSHFAPLQASSPAYSGNYVVQNQANTIPNTVPSTQFFNQASAMNQMAVPIPSHSRHREPVVYKEGDHVNSNSRYRVNSSSLLSVHQRQPSTEGTLEYGVHTVITSPKQEQTLSCDNTSFAHHAPCISEPALKQPHLMPISSHYPEKQPSVMETPPCSPCVTSHSVQTLSNMVSSNSKDTKVSLFSILACSVHACRVCAPDYNKILYLSTF